MTIRIFNSYRTDKDLGRACNQDMALLSNEDWACLMDYDTCFLLPSTISHLYQYAERFSHVGMFTCFTNRIHELSSAQYLGKAPSEDFDIRNHIEIARNQERKLYEATPLTKEVSGFLMLISKRTWNQFKFREGIGCLGVDNSFCWELMASGKSIYRMDGIYVWHTYRAFDIRDKSHLK